MPLAAGTRLGPYEVLGLIGAGGMGEVYKAKDSNLKRLVAIKILPQTVRADPERLARFQREAEVLASLNHPNIAHIHGLEKFDGTLALVMEFVDGEDLAARIARRGAVPLDEGIPIALQIAEALEAAHEQGIVHRDLKPANIKVGADGTAKVLDFGLAKAFAAPETSDGPPPPMANSPTFTSPFQMSQLGVILGTAAYMAPEQAKGRPVDRRADIWAFGIVLYELLSGRRPFNGEDVPDTLAALLRQPIDWSALPAETPAIVRHLLTRCLERDARKRLRDIGEARIALENPSLSSIAAGVSPEPPPFAIESRRAWWKRVAPLAMTAVITALIVALAVWYLKPVPAGRLVRLEYPLTAGLTSAPLAHPFLAVSPDGAQIAYVYGTPRRLYVRRISELGAQAVPGTENLGDFFAPAFSPDGRMLAFWSGDGTIKRVQVEGGAVLTLCRAENPHGLSWGETGIVFAQSEKATIMRVSPDGGTPEVVARTKPGHLVSGPEVLPGGRFLIYSVTADVGVDRWDKARIVAHSLQSGDEHTILEGGSDAHYLPTGHLVYATGGVLFAAPFDARHAQLERPGVPVLSGVRRANPGVANAHYAVSDAGTLVYVPGPAAASAIADLGLFDRNGNVRRLNLPLGTYSTPRISPDGRRLAFTVGTGQEEFIAVYELAGATAMRRLTLGGHNVFPVWASDGRRVAYQSDREGDVSIFWQPADGSGAAERLTRAGPGESHAPESWSSTTNTLLFSVHKDGEDTLWALSLPDRHVVPFDGVRSKTPINAVFSPDGRWIAYQSDQSGRTTVYVQPVPPTGAVYQLVPRGNDAPHEPVWSPDKQLFYNPRAGGFEVVPVTMEPEFSFGYPTALPRPFRLTPPQGRRSYDVAPDGRIVAVIVPQDSDESPGGRHLEVVLNWHEELNAKVPVHRP